MNNLGTVIFTQGAQKVIVLWEIDFSTVIGYEPTVNPLVYISAYRDNKDDIIFDGKTYNYVGVDWNGYSTELNGQLSSPTLSLDKNGINDNFSYDLIKDDYQNQTGEFWFDWRGATVTRIIVNVGEINNPSNASRLTMLATQVNQTSKAEITVQLSDSVAADRLNSLSVQSLAPNRCALRYRVFDGSFQYTDEKAGGCPYGNPTSASDWTDVPNFGNLYFDEDGNPTTPANDKCNLSVGACLARFDPDENGLTLPFQGLYTPVSNDPKQNPPGILPNG